MACHINNILKVEWITDCLVFRKVAWLINKDLARFVMIYQVFEDINTMNHLVF